MKKIILTAIIAFGALFSYGQNTGLEKINYKKSAVTNALQIKALDSRLKFIQNGKFTTIDKTYSAENYYIDMFEITNSFYNAFLNDLKNNNLNDLFDKCIQNGKFLAKHSKTPQNIITPTKNTTNFPL